MCQVNFKTILPAGSFIFKLYANVYEYTIYDKNQW